MFPEPISVLTISNCVDLPSTLLLKPNTGISVFVPFTLYCSALIPLTVSVLFGLPKTPFAGSAEFNTLTNCSYQS